MAERRWRRIEKSAKTEVRLSVSARPRHVEDLWIFFGGL
jgi:hypothetical protein